MEQNQDSSLFGLGIDPIAKNHLSEAARWAKFLAIIGFIICGLIIVAGIFAGSILSSLRSSQYGMYENDTNLTGAMTTVMAVMYILIALLYFFPCLFLYRFATKMKTALLGNDQDVLNSSFQNLKITFRYVGIVMIIVLSIYAIVFLVALAGMGAGRM